jgi:hypothetical protein
LGISVGNVVLNQSHCNESLADSEHFSGFLFHAGRPMIVRIHRDENLNKQLRVLQASGAQGARVAEHVEALIERLVFKGERTLGEIGRLTRYGEARLRGGIKYDLVHGYRLVGMRQGEDLFLVFVGSHDECNRWVRSNRRMRTVVVKDGNEILPVRGEESQAGMDDGEEEADDDYLGPVLDRLTDTELRKIFSGLCGRDS